MSSVEKNRLKHDFNRAAGHYDEHALLQKNVAHNLFSMALERWPNGAHVLDAGAGTGFFSRFSKLNNKGLHIIALDIAWRMCELSSHEPYTMVVNADMEMLPLQSASLDNIFSSLALQWVGSSAAVFKECYRVLKSDGEILFATIVEGTLAELEESFTAIGEPHRIGSFTTEEALQKDLSQAGFMNISISFQPIVLHYPDVLSLLHSIKQIGAASKFEDRNRGILKRSSLRQLEDIYKSKFMEEDRLKATWNIVYINAKKP